MLKSLLRMLKIGTIVPPQLKDNGAFANNTYFDTAGLNGLMILLAMGATDIAVGSTDSTTAPYLEECDTTGGTYTKVTSSDLSGVISATDDNKVYGWAVDLTKSHKRYIRINAPTAGDGTTGANAAAIALGFPADQSPRTAAEMGLAQLVQC